VRGVESVVPRIALEAKAQDPVHAAGAVLERDLGAGLELELPRPADEGRLDREVLADFERELVPDFDREVLPDFDREVLPDFFDPPRERPLLLDLDLAPWLAISPP